MSEANFERNAFIYMCAIKYGNEQFAFAQCLKIPFEDLCFSHFDRHAIC